MTIMASKASGTLADVSMKVFGRASPPGKGFTDQSSGLNPRYWLCCS